MGGGTCSATSFDDRQPRVEAWVDSQQAGQDDDYRHNFAALLENVARGWQVVIDSYTAMIGAMLHVALASIKGHKHGYLTELPALIGAVVVATIFLNFLVRYVRLDPDRAYGIHEPPWEIFGRIVCLFVWIRTLGKHRNYSQKDAVDCAIVCLRLAVILLIVLQKVVLHADQPHAALVR